MKTLEEIDISWIPVKRDYYSLLLSKEVDELNSVCKYYTRLSKSCKTREQVLNLVVSFDNRVDNLKIRIRKRLNINKFGMKEELVFINASNRIFEFNI